MTENLPLLHVSASQLKTYRRCARKWFWEKIRGFRSPDTRATLLGKHVHSLLEHYLEHGKVPTHLFDPQFPEAWDIALPGLENLPPPPVPADHIERAFLLTCFSVPAYGFIDLLEPGDNLVTDHKTTSNLRYAFGHGNPEKSFYKPASLLLSDPQALLYSAVAPYLFDSTPDSEYLDLPVTTVRKANTLDPLDFRHVYYRTRGAPRSVQTRVTLSSEDLGNGLDKIDSTINAMALAAKKPNAEDIPPNLAACEDYGGCPHRGRCQAIGDVKLSGLAAMFAGESAPTTTKTKPTTTKEKKSMGFFDKPRKSKGTEKPANLKALLQCFWDDGPQSSGNAYMEKEGLIKNEDGRYILSSKGVEMCSSLGLKGAPSLGNKPDIPEDKTQAEIANPAESKADPPAVSDKHQDILRVLWTNGSLDFCAQALVESGLVEQRDGKYVLTEEGLAYCKGTLGLTGDPPDNRGQEGAPDGRSPDPNQMHGAADEFGGSDYGDAVPLNPPDGTDMRQKTEPPKKAGRKATMRCPVDVPDGQGGYILRTNDPIKSTAGKPDMTAIRKVVLAGLSDEQNTLYYSLTNLAETKGNKPHLYADLVLLVQIVNGQTPDNTKAGDGRLDNQKAAPGDALALADHHAENAKAIQEWAKNNPPESASPTPATDSTTTATEDTPGTSMLEIWNSMSLEDRERVRGKITEQRGAPVLYLDAMPLHVIPTRLEVWLQPLLDAIARGEIAPGDEPVTHYRAMPYDNGLKRLCQGLVAWLRDGKLELPAHLVVDRKAYCGNAAVEVLLPRYQAKGYSIVQGLK